MKFIAPEVEIKMFNVSDILTASGDPEVTETISAWETYAEGDCSGNDSDWLVPACL